MITLQIICFGDSNTYGFDPRDFWEARYNADNRWVDLLAKHLDCKVVNDGVNGRVIPRRPDALPMPTEKTCGDIILIMLGTNDLLEGASAKDIASRMEAFLKGILPCYKQIILIAPPPLKRGAWVPGDELVNESICLADEYMFLAQKLTISFVDTRRWNVELTFDGVHFTESGHHAFAAHLAAELRQWQS